MYYYSNEIVFRGHPDKVCDQISAAILRECMAQDKNTRAGIETVGGKGKIFDDFVFTEALARVFAVYDFFHAHSLLSSSRSPFASAKPMSPMVSMPTMTCAML